MKKNQKNILIIIIVVPIVILVGLLITFLVLNKKPSYRVSFDTNGGSQISSVKITEGHKVSRETDALVPTKSGFVFVGWYTDADLTYLYDFNTLVYYDFTLYAKWELALVEFSWYPI
ncbi:MAG: InlB B-repeat-containing protein [Acholeplasmatales bacterium]|jgi:uncharacterized repeat protein (TIGR02543 family)|nr:InlB B-repeat-containing protein [Acholeplasmatales bacterium]